MKRPDVVTPAEAYARNRETIDRELSKSEEWPPVKRPKTATRPRTPTTRPDVVTRFLDGEPIESLAWDVFARRRLDKGLPLGDQLALARAGVEEAIRAWMRERR